MALINCPECKAQISDKASSCPKCGNPMAQPPPFDYRKTSAPTTNTPPPEEPGKPMGNGTKVLILIGLVGIMFTIVSSYAPSPGARASQDHRENIDEMCEKMMSDSALGNERRMTRQMCDDLKARNK